LTLNQVSFHWQMNIDSDLAPFMLLREFKIFLVSLSFLTRLPVFLKEKTRTELIPYTPRYYTFAGFFIGSAAAFVFSAASYIFPHEISVIFMLLSVILLTGAFHEDGLMDFFDGFGGGYSKKQILEIMKDPRSGSYGILAAVFSVLLKIFILFEMKSSYIIFGVLFAHMLSRFSTVSFLPWMDYARSEGKSSFLKNRMRILEILFSLLPVILFSAFFYSEWIFILTAFLTSYLFSALFMFYIYKKIGGYTGDCLGALQQISEILIYAVLLVWKN